MFSGVHRHRIFILSLQEKQLADLLQVTVLNGGDTLSLLPLPPWPSDEPILFRVPAIKDLVMLAERLTRFGFPPDKHHKYIERFLHQHLSSPLPQKRALTDVLSPVLTEAITHTLWQACLGPYLQTEEQNTRTSLASQSDQLALWLLFQEARTFSPVKMAKTDASELMNFLPPDHTEALRIKNVWDLELSENTAPLPTQENMERFLQHFRQVPMVPSNPPDTIDAMATFYLTSRRLSYPLPLAELAYVIQHDPSLALDVDAQVITDYQTLLEQSEWHTVFTPEAMANPTHLFSKLDDQCASDPIWRASAIYMNELVLVEGITEKMLLPHFAKADGLDFDTEAIHLIAVGGKNQMVSTYQIYSQQLRVPIMVLLDDDAIRAEKQLHQICRNNDTVCDHIYRIKNGEFEDLYDENLVVATINQHYAPHPPVTLQQLQHAGADHPQPLVGLVQRIQHLWHEHQFGQFDKIHFASRMMETEGIATSSSKGIQTILDKIRTTLPDTTHAHNTKAP